MTDLCYCLPLSLRLTMILVDKCAQKYDPCLFRPLFQFRKAVSDIPYSSFWTYSISYLKEEPYVPDIPKLTPFPPSPTSMICHSIIHLTLCYWTFVPCINTYITSNIPSNTSPWHGVTVEYEHNLYPSHINQAFVQKL